MNIFLQLTFVCNVVPGLDHDYPGHVVAVVEDGRLFLEHDFHALHQLLHRPRTRRSADAASE